MSWRERYEAHRSAGAAAVQEGRFAEALTCFEAALEAARAGDDADLVDRAVCNRAAVAIELGQHRESIPKLREILMAGQDPENAFRAAAQVARAYEHLKEHRKGAFYARIACDRARFLTEKKHLADARNRLGNLLAGMGLLDEAEEAYRSSFELLDGTASFRHAVVLDNLGYCCTLRGKRSEGFSLLVRSLRLFRRLGTRYPLIHLDLAHAYLEANRPRPALRHALRGLALAESEERPDLVKNGLYLSGESVLLLGDDEEARSYFDRLQRFFPDNPKLSDFLLAVDVRRMINLRA